MFGIDAIQKRRAALVTGGSRGIGRGIALALADVGYDVAFNHMDPDNIAAEETVKELQTRGARAFFRRGDIASPADRSTLIASVRREFGKLNLLVNNAGVAPAQRVDILEAGEESFDRLISINLKGPYFLTQLAARWMIEERGADRDMFLAIVNISSISAFTSSPNRGEYCISKAGVSMATKLWADRLAEHDILVYEIQPGIIATDMTASVKDKYDKLIAEGLTPIRRWGTPEDVGRAVAAIAQGYFPFSTGQVLNLDGGFHLRRL